MIGDGMGFNHILATNFYNTGDTITQSYESFPVKLASCTYPAKTGSYPEKLHWSAGYNPRLAWTDFSYVKENCTESAASATALATGKKTYNNAIGLDVNGDRTMNLTEFAKSLGKSAGVVTSVPFSHATPAGFVAHNATRKNYADIAREMIIDSKCDVIMGCGNPEYDDNAKPVHKKYTYVGDSLLWLALHENSKSDFIVAGSKRSVQDIDGDHRADPWTVIEDKTEFEKLTTGKTPKRVLGVPKVHTTLQVRRDGDTKAAPYTVPFNQNVPSLATMAQGAVNILKNNKKGFFLMIEGGTIDWAGHGNQSGRLIEELTGFNATVDAIVHWVESKSSWDETLVIVTADHETGYLWGPGSGAPATYHPLVNNGKGSMPGMQWYSEDHTNSLVPFFAKGSGSDVYKILADEQDSVRGSFIQNSEVAGGIFMLWR